MGFARVGSNPTLVNHLFATSFSNSSLLWEREHMGFREVEKLYY